VGLARRTVCDGLEMSADDVSFTVSTSTQIHNIFTHLLPTSTASWHDTVPQPLWSATVHVLLFDILHKCWNKN